MRFRQTSWANSCAVGVVMISLACSSVLCAAGEDRAKTGAETTFRIAPYLQNASHTAVTVMWETKDPTTSAVEYWKPGNREETARTVTDESSVRIHKVRITGLKPDTRYGYRVRCGEDIRESTFSTAPEENRPIRFAIFGDSRFWGDYWQTSPLPEHLMSQEPEFALHMGDLVNDGRKYTQWPDHFARFESVLRRLPMFSARGNHERHDPKNDWFGKYHELPGGEPYSSFDWGNSHFAIVSYTHIGKCASFLDADLRATRKKWKFVVFHYPVYCTGYAGPSDDRKAAGNPQLEAIFDRYGVDMVFTGHTHIYERSFPLRGGRRDDRSGTVYLVQGGAVGGNYPDWWTATIARDLSLPHYSFLEVTDDRIELRSYGLAKGDQRRGKAARIVEIDHYIRWKDEKLPKGILGGLPRRDGTDLLDAIETLGAACYAPAANALIGYLSRPDPRVRRAAALALERIADPAVSQRLVGFLRDNDIAVRRHVARALEAAMPGDTAWKIVPEILDPAQDSRVRQRLLGALLHHAPERAFRVAMAALDTNDGDVRDRAADVVKRTASRADVPALVAMLRQERRPYVAGCLAWALNRIRGKKVDIEKEEAAPVPARQP
jgi:hypothetical protein